MAGKSSEATIRLWARLMRAQQTALAAIEQSLSDAGLPPLVWYDVLLETERAGEQGMRPFELEREMLLTQYNLSRLLDRIVKAGYVERRPCEEDRRGHRIVITDAGRAVRRQMWPVYDAAIEKAVGRHLTDVETETLGRLLGVLVHS